VHKFNKLVIVPHSDIVSYFLVIAVFYCANTTALHMPYCLTGNFWKGVFRLNSVAKWVAA